jgi:hypothetical protein
MKSNELTTINIIETKKEKRAMATIRELIEALEEQAQAYGDDCEVKLMTQEKWPFENAIYGITSSADIDIDVNGESEECGDFLPKDPDHDTRGRKGHEEKPSEKKPISIYLVEGRQLRYGNQNAWLNCEKLQGHDGGDF